MFFGGWKIEVRTKGDGSWENLNFISSPLFFSKMFRMGNDRDYYT